MVEKFLHTSDLLWTFLLFFLVNRISYSFPPCFLRCEPVFISYISLQMHHVDLALAKNRLASTAQFICPSKSESFYEFRHNRIHPNARMHISSRRLDALDESHRTKKNVILHDAPQPDTLFPMAPYTQMRLTPSLASAAFAFYTPIYALLPEPQSCGSLSEC